MVSLVAALVLGPSLPLGEYRLDMGSEWRRLRLLSSNYFTFEAGGCFHRESTDGHYVVSRGRVLFDPPIDVNVRGRPSSQILIVPWGKTALLAPEHELASLGAMAQRGGDPAKVASYFFRIPSAAKELSGLPELPKPFDRPLRSFRAVFAEGKVATIDGGREDGLLPGTALETGDMKTKIVGLVRRSLARRAEVAWMSLGDAKELPVGSRLEIAMEGGLFLGRALGETLLRPEYPGR